MLNPVRARTSWLLLLLMLFQHGAFAATFEKGLLWKVERDGATPSYVFGTMHSEDERVLDLPREVKEIFDDSSSYTMEVLLDMNAALQMSQAMMLTDGKDLKALLGTELYGKVVPLMAQRGVPEMVLPAFKPWAVFVTLSMPPPKTGVFLDAMLHQEAEAQKKKVHGLESVAEQLSVFEKMSLKDQIEMVADTVKHHDEMPAAIEELLNVYLKRDLRGLQDVNAKYMAIGDPALGDRLMDTLIDQRNLRMVERMQARLKEGNAFVAVGALHLPGENGILNMLAKKGYRVTAVY
jgi:hypothetical protein